MVTHAKKSLLASKSTHATKSTHSTHTTSAAPLAATAAAPAAVQATTSATAPPGGVVAVPVPGPPSPTPIDDLAAQAIAQMDAIEAGLDLNIVVPPNDKNQMRSLRRISATALDLASKIVSDAPESFPAFADLPSATAYVKAMLPVSDRAQTLATHILNSVLNQRTPAATQTLALYGVAKNVGRITSNETMREHVNALKEEVAPRRKTTKPKLTKSEKAARKAELERQARVDKAVAFLTANGYPIPQAPGSPPASTPTTVTPSPSPSPPPVAPATPAATNGAATVATPQTATH